MTLLKLVICVALLICSEGVYAQKVGLLMDSYFIDRWYLDEKFIKERVTELGGECVVEMPEGNPDEQVRLGKKLIESGIDVLVIIASDAKKAVEIVDMAEARNIPVVAYDRVIASNNVDCYVSFNSLLVGKLQSLYATTKLPEGKYILINGPLSDNNAVLFREGQLSRLQTSIDAGKVSLLADLVLKDWNELEAMMRLDSLFATSPQIPDVIIAGNDALATGAIQALPVSRLGKVIVIRQDAEVLAIKNIIKGHQTMTIYKPIKQLAYQAAEVALNLAKKQPLPDFEKFRFGDIELKAILLNPVIVDKDNYESTVIKDGHVKLDLPPKKR